jgi:hypothetical protein
MLSLSPGIPDEANIEVVVHTPVLWSGWEADYDALLYRIAPESEIRMHVFGSVDVSPRNLIETLKERLAEYERVVDLTRLFLQKAHLAYGNVFDVD